MLSNISGPSASLRCWTVFVLLILVGACAAPADNIYEQKTQKAFADVIQDAEFMITEKNFRITNRLHIGQAIQERGSDTFPDHEVILFCNLSIAESMLVIEPRYINYCPYKLAVVAVNDGLIVSTRLMPEQSGNQSLDQVAKNINVLLRSMVDYAANDDPFAFEDG